MSTPPDLPASEGLDPGVEAPAPRPASPDEADARPEPGARLRTAQFYLAALGYRVAGSRDPAGAVDGVLGHNTRGAIEQFQLDQDIERSGQLDPETWEALVDAYQEAREVESPAPTTDEGDAMVATSAADLEQVAGLTGDALDDIEDAPLALEDGPPEVP